MLLSSDGIRIALGFIAFGGKQQRGRVCLSLSGTGCNGLERDQWHRLIGALADRRGKITRIDIAVDDMKGKTLSLGGARKAHNRGVFNPAKGRPPTARWFGCDNGGGNTLYIGSRTAGKMFRAYQKGRQLGDPDSPWIRFEVELHSKDREIPFDVLADPLRYFRGAYQYLSRVVPDDVEATAIPTKKATAKISARRAIAIARQQCGGLIHRLLAAGADAEKICMTLERASKSRRLQVWSLPEAVVTLELDSACSKPVHTLPIWKQGLWAGPRLPAYAQSTSRITRNI